MRFGGVVICAGMVGTVGAAVLMAPDDRVSGALTGPDKVGIYTAVLDDRYSTTTAAPRYLIDVHDQLTTSEHAELTLRYPARWVRLSEIDTSDSSPGSVLVDSLYPPEVANGSVTVRVGELCGHRCASGSTYVLDRAGSGWRIVSRNDAPSD